MKRISALFLAAILALSLFGCSSKPAEAPKADAPKAAAPAPAPAPAPAQKVTIKVAMQVAEATALYKGSAKFKELVEKGSGGAIEVQLFPNAQLGNEKDMIEGVKLGTIQMALPSAPALGQFYPKVGVFGMPYIWNGKDESEEFQNMSKVVRGPVGQAMRDEAAKTTGILPLDFAWWYGDRHVTNNKKPIKTPQDMVGLKIRVPDAPVNVAPIKAMGATAVPMAFGDVYMALKTGTVDGQENPIGVTFAQKFHEVQKYVSLTGHMSQNQVPIMNAAFFNKLTPDQQKLIMSAAVEAGDYQSAIAIKENNDNLDQMKAAGLQINTVDKDVFRKAISDVVYEQFKAQIGDLYQKVRDAQK